jgi:hypothetical protein
MALRQRIDFEIPHAATGITYDPWVVAGERPDATWEAVLEFVPRDGGESYLTDVETTQPAAKDVLYWAGGLSDAYFQGAFDRAFRGTAGRKRSPAAQRPATPLDPDDRFAQLRMIERLVMETFRANAATTLPTAHFFRTGPWSNADFVRSFEDLEKRWRYLVRRTEGGTDRLNLTVEGAQALGLAVDAAEKVVAEPAQPR